MPKPILLVDHAPALGGAEYSLLLLLENLDRTRWTFHLACTGGPLAERATKLGVSVHQIALPRLRGAPWRLWQDGRSLAQVLRRTDACCLIANTTRAALYAALAGKLAHVPFIWYRRDFWLGEAAPRRPWADKLGKRLLCAAASHIIANSHATARHLPCEDKTMVIHNGIEITHFDPTLDGRAFRQQYGIPLDAPLIGVVGRLRPWKGQERFLRVLRALPETVWGVVVGGSPFGDDAYAQTLRDLAKTLGITGRVVFTGQLADPRPALAALDVFVHPGSPEPFGLVNVEAMAMAKPVVAFAHGALPEIVAEGETGSLVAPGDEAAMTAALAALLRDPQRCKTWGLAGRRRVEQHFTVQQTAASVDALLAERCPPLSPANTAR